MTHPEIPDKVQNVAKGSTDNDAKSLDVAAKQLAEWIYAALKNSSALREYGCLGYVAPLELPGGTAVDGEFDFLAVGRFVLARLHEGNH